LAVEWISSSTFPEQVQKQERGRELGEEEEEYKILDGDCIA
jgi:hypothetical protein